MYQRFAITKPLRPEPEDQADDKAQDPIRNEEEDARQNRHDKNHGSRDHGLLARRPSDLGALGPHLLNEFEWIRPGHISSAWGYGPSRGLLRAVAQISCGAKLSASRHLDPTISWDRRAYNASFSACR